MCWVSMSRGVVAMALRGFRSRIYRNHRDSQRIMSITGKTDGDHIDICWVSGLVEQDDIQAELVGDWARLESLDGEYVHPVPQSEDFWICLLGSRMFGGI